MTQTKTIADAGSTPAGSTIFRINIQNKKRSNNYYIMATLYIFDFDDTLAMTDSHVRVIRIDGSVERLDSRQFAKYRYADGDQLDFSEFTRADGTLIEDTVDAMEDAISSSGIQNVYIVTARAQAEPVEEFLEAMGVSVPEVVATAGSEGKATWLTRQLETNSYDTVMVLSLIHI